MIDMTSMMDTVNKKVAEKVKSEASWLQKLIDADALPEGCDASQVQVVPVKKNDTEWEIEFRLASLNDDAKKYVKEHGYHNAMKKRKWV